MVHSAGGVGVSVLQQVGKEPEPEQERDQATSAAGNLSCTTMTRVSPATSPPPPAAATIATTAAAAAVVLTPPLSLVGGLAAEHRPPNLAQRIISLFRNVRPGSDLTHFQLPPVFNMPKSQLQVYGEAVYCVNTDILGRCAGAKTSFDRFASVLAWSISTTRPPIFGLAPFNPVLGETHHVSNGTLNVLLEQVSHHPPVSALHATDEAKGVELLWCQRPVPRFSGASIEARIRGKRILRLLNHGETYEMDAPSLLVRLLPVPGAEWSGKVRVDCKESGLLAELNYCRTRSVLGFGGNSRSVKGSVFSYGPNDLSSTKPQLVAEIEGQWDGRVTLKDVSTGKVTPLYDATEAIGNLKAPVLVGTAAKEGRGSPSVSPTESAIVWSAVSRCILQRDWDGARAAKAEVEETARRRRAADDSRHAGQIWDPKHFTIAQNKEGEWECWPKASTVGPAPIIITS